MRSFTGPFDAEISQMIEYLRKGALIIDVRTHLEFERNCIAGSKNIPLHTIGSQMNDIVNLRKPLILCCASGIRSGQAAIFLQRNGIDCINGGSWNNVAQAIGRPIES
ncbi:MAG: rhodanese-like domain-containing protein [Cyclobacteriaceae bacterium]